MNTAVKRQPIPFGKYLLLDRINIGGMAEVWRGKTFGAGGFERLVAIKRILPNIAEDEEFISMFIDEAKITVQLNHANIAQIYELSHIVSSYFIAMEYIPGKDMRAIFDRCRKKGEPAPIPLTCYVLGKACEGLDYAHRKSVNGRDMNIVHRDVSPQNVLISYDGEVKVIDFGIAKAAGKATKTQAGILKGKFGYMSPEQIRGLPLDRRSDVFALGVCLYEMLTGERLFVGDSDFSVLEKVRKVEVLPPSTYNRKIPEGLEKIVMKALAKDVDDRYQYASEVADDLQRFLITSESIFGRKDLAQYMKSTFAEEVDREKQRILEYSDIKPPDGMAAAAEMGFGMGLVPAASSNPPTTASAVTNIPTVLPTLAPGGPPSLTGTATASASTRAPPPMLSPTPSGSIPIQLSSSDRLPALNPRPSAPAPGAVPRLTAAAPMLTNGKEDNSTQLVDGDTLFNFGGSAAPGALQDNPDSATLAMQSPFGGAPAVGDSAAPTDPARQKVARYDQPISEATPMPELSDMTMPPGSPAQMARVTVVESARANPVIRTRRSSGPRQELSEDPTNGEAAPQPSAPSPTRRRRSPTMQPGALSAQAAPQASGGSGIGKLLVIMIAAVVVLLGGGLSALFFLKSDPKGLVLIEVPDKAEVAEITINGEPITEKDGSPLKSGPHIQAVKAGVVTVLIKVKGYKPLIETVTVK